VDQINMMMQQIQTDSNRVVVAMLPDKEGISIPSEDQLAQVLEAVDAEDIEVFVDNVKDEPLIASLPAPGSIVKEAANKLWGTTEWTLSNGVKVIVKSTKFKEDEIIMSAVANQGLSRTLGNISPASFLSLDIMSESFGIGSYTDNDLKKYLAGKQVSLAPSFSMYSRRISGSTTPRDLSSLLELTYGMFTDFNMEASEFEAAQAIYSGMLKNQQLNPQAVFLKDVYNALFTSPYRQMLTAEDVEAANREEMLAVMRSQLANAADYTFTFVGNVDIDSLRPLVEQYIATLPANAKTATKAVKKAVAALEPKAGEATDTYTTRMENPQTWVMIYEGGNMKFTSRDAKLASIAGQILSARLLESVREKEGAVYSISAQGSLSTPEGMNTAIQSAFPMKPEMKEKVLGMIKAEFTDMETNITDEELNKVKEFMIKSYTEGKERNGAWLNGITTFVLDGVDTFNGNIETIKAITPADVKKFMKTLNGQHNYRVIILDPEQ
ncbi:MAG: insulinase family protein, partial [Muribaculaceae bacterium]|nr:insulinase family protein [Muribaculaceae bacterium]